jgi:hypothetical protein
MPAFNLPVSSAGFDELARRPERARETATVVPGTGTAVLPISLLLDFAEKPDAQQRLRDFADALIEEEHAFAMAILDTDDTGIFNTLWFIPAPGIQHGPRIKVAIDPERAVSPSGKLASVPFDPKKPAEGEISPPLERQVRAFIDFNRDVLLDYWNLKISSTKKFLAQIKALPKS